jgi:hypothetical protein
MHETTRMVALAAVVVLVAACKREQPAENPQPFTPTDGSQPYGQQSPYGQQPQPTYGQPAPTMTATAPPPQQPVNPLSPPCQQPEGTCGWAKCNMAVGRCFMPCSTNADCVAGAQCLGLPGTPLMTCMPAMGFPTQ